MIEFVPLFLARSESVRKAISIKSQSMNKWQVLTKLMSHWTFFQLLSIYTPRSQSRQKYFHSTLIVHPEWRQSLTRYRFHITNVTYAGENVMNRSNSTCNKVSNDDNTHENCEWSYYSIVSITHCSLSSTHMPWACVR